MKGQGSVMLKLGVIGVGNMGSALLGGILKKGIVSPEQILLCDPNSAQYETLCAQGINWADSPQEVVERCEYVMLSIKPQGFTDLLEEIKPVCKGQNVFVSIAAGISSSFIKKGLGYDAKVVPLLPNLPSLRRCAAFSRPAAMPLRYPPT